MKGKGGVFMEKYDISAAAAGLIPKRPVCRYTYLSPTAWEREHFEVFLPRKVGYLAVRFMRCYSVECNHDIWRIVEMVAVDDMLEKRYELTTWGEFELAVRLVGRPDFSGGSNHGDEHTDVFSVSLDGVPTPLTALTELTPFERMTVLRDSRLYDPSAHDVMIGTHHVNYKITTEGVLIDQDVMWAVDEACTTSYMAMFPVLRTTEDRDGNTVHVSETYTDGVCNEVFDVREAGLAECPQRYKKGVRRMTLHSEELGVTASLHILKLTDLPGGNYSQCSPKPAYNKLYDTIVGFGEGEGYRVSAGDLWAETTYFTLDIDK